MKNIATLKLSSQLVLALLAASSLSACNTVDRLKNVGAEPKQSSVINPMMKAGYKPVSMPMPDEKMEPQQANSLWTGAQRGFFKDQRATKVGDILTVVIDIKDKGELKNETTRSRSGSESANMNALLGYEQDLPQILSDQIDNTNLASLGSTSSSSGSGDINREEKIEMKLAATVLQVLPNGNMVIEGNQEVRVNYENRVLKLAGVVRREDIGTDNTISYEKIAEARIAYGGKGHISDVQQPRYGQQVYDILFPF